MKPGIFVTHAGTGRSRGGHLVTRGGRVLSVTALGTSPTRSRAAAYAAANMIHFEGKQMRNDIALKLVK